MKSINYISKLHNKDSKEVLFHAYHWGKFKLTKPEEIAGYTFFAQSTSSSLDFRLSLKDDIVHLHLSDLESRILTIDIETLFENKAENREYILYDNRQALNTLYSHDQMYRSPFKDPEDFEEVVAYKELILGIDKHFNKLLNIKSIKVEEIKDKKFIYLETNKGSFEIQIQKELFDMELLHSLNRILKHKSEFNKSLYLSIDPKMHMVFLLLNAAAHHTARRIGLLV